MNCDLHTHSYYSDGTCSPAEIVAEAKKRELIVALTDHNTVSGLPEFMEEAQRQGVTAVPGAELSVEHCGKELHLLALFVEPQHYGQLTRLVKEFHVLKEISNMEMVERLNRAGYDIDYVEIKKRNPDGNINRAHVAAELYQVGYVSSVAEAFATLLSDGGGYYVPPERLQMIDAVKLLREIKAVPVWAHPLHDVDEEEARRILPPAIEAGLMGMETYHESYGEKEFSLAAELAREFGLLESGGSDFHGTVKPKISLGTGRGNLSIPVSVYENLLRAKCAL